MGRSLSLGVRFAPSPTGRFHIGNLRTAWVSTRIARALHQPWIVRIEDIDTARSSEQLWLQQYEDLKALGLIPDSIHRQSERYVRHLEAFERARAEGRVYPCDCSRKDVLESLSQIESAPHQPTPEYSGHCRGRSRNDVFKPIESLAWRWRNTAEDGRDDAIVARTDRDGENFIPGYHWACAIDDAEGDYSVLVRAWDLATVEKTQRAIRRWSCGPRVLTDTEVFHTSLVIREDGGRLEKRTKGVTLDDLITNGSSPAALLVAFEKSFDEATALRAIHDAAPVGEIARKISVNFFLP